MLKVLLTFLILPSFVFADFNVSGYIFKKQIITPKDEGKEFSLKIDSDVYKNGNQFFSDFRVVDKNNNEVPYKIEKSFDKREVKVTEKKINIVSKKGDTYVLDLGREKKYYQNIKIGTASKDFSRVVDVYASNLEGARYKMISDPGGSVIFSGPTGSEKRAYFRYTDFRFIKIVFSGSEGNFKLENFFVEKKETKVVEGEKEVLDLEFEELASQNKKEQRFLIKVKKKNLPISSIALHSKDSNFLRNIKIFSSNTKEASFLENTKRYNKNDTYWKKIFTGSFSKKIYSQEQSFFINDNKKYYFLVIENGDDKKVSIDKITGTSFSDIVFLNNMDFINNSYKIFYGNVFAKKPKYDTGNIQKDFKNRLFLDIEKENFLYKEPKKSLKEQKPYLMIVLIGILVLILSWFSYKILKESSFREKKSKENFVGKL